MGLLIFFAFLSGLATIVSPCVLPVLPLLLSTSVAGGRWRPVAIVIGFAASFAAATLALAAVLQALGLPQDILRLVAVLALALFGLSMLIPSWGQTFERRLSPIARAGATTKPGSGFAGGLALGAGLGLVWSPCVGPIMASVIALAVTSGVSGAGVSITLSYALGAAIPMLLIAYGARKIASNAKGLGTRTQIISRVFGGLTVLTALLLLFGLQSSVQSLIPTNLSNNLTGYEQSATVQKEIGTLKSDDANKPTLPAIPAITQPTATPVPAAANVDPTPPVARKPAAAFPDLHLNLHDMGPAPELTGLQGWINSEPLTLKGLRGKVVIVDFWTFECYNCANTRPYVQALYEKYHKYGLEILGIHTPEFAYERVPANVAKATKDQGINWPVALDPDYKTWSAYNNMYWPAFYFIDAKGQIRYEHFGEGNYDYNEKVVQQLLHEAETSQ